MRIGLFGDIHGDYANMSRVVERLEREQPDLVVCTGDLVVHGPDSNACVELLRSHPEWLCVRGNHDIGASCPEEELQKLRFFSASGYKHTLEARAQLSEENRAYLASLPDTVELPGALVTHATLKTRFELLNNVFTITETFADMGSRVLFTGHTHRSLVHRLDRGRVATIRPLILDRPVRLDIGEKVIVNVGNTAQLKYDRFPPVYVLYDTEEQTATFHSLEE